jgi:hypothetical protein
MSRCIDILEYVPQNAKLSRHVECQFSKTFSCITWYSLVQILRGLFHFVRNYQSYKMTAYTYFSAQNCLS